VVHCGLLRLIDKHKAADNGKNSKRNERHKKIGQYHFVPEPDVQKFVQYLSQDAHLIGC